MTVKGSDPLEQLMASGAVTEDMSVEQIAELVRKAESGEQPTLEQPTQPSAETPPVAETPQVATVPPATEVIPPAQAAATPPAPATTPAEPEGPVTTPSGQPIPYSVLRNTRADRDQLRADNTRLTARLTELEEKHRRDTEALQQQLQARGTPATSNQQQEVQRLANRAGLRDAQGNPIDVASVDLSQYAGQYPEEILNLIGALQATVVDLRESDAQRRAREQNDTRTQEQIDIDSVPLIAEWHSAKDDTMWNAASAAYQSLRNQPEWKDKSRVEVLQEVASRLGGAARPSATTQTTTTPPAVTPGTKPLATHIADARSRSVPLSHSDLPAGSPPAQGEAEQLDSLDITQLAERYNSLTPAQQEALLARYG